MRKIRVAINGYGRIGRSVLRALYERSHEALPIQIVAINGSGSLPVNAHLTQYDTSHGRFKETVDATETALRINGKDHIQFLSQKDRAQLPWKALDIDVVYECTGTLNDRKSAENHLKAGAKKVLISSPFKDADATVIYGVNHHLLQKSNTQIVSMASCTTNALATVIQPLEAHIGIEQAVMTTIHAYTHDQRLLDNHHTDLYRARSATQSMIPTKTGAAAMIGTIFPNLQGKIKGLSVRVPVSNVSLLDLSFSTSMPVSTVEINHILQHASQNTLEDTLDYCNVPLVSSDFNHNPKSAVVLAQETIATNNLVKVLAWYDNEWGFSNRMLDITMAWFSH